MNAETIRHYCLSKKAAEESLPFDETTLVFKVMGKMFALFSFEREMYINLKCAPEKAVLLRERFPSVGPGYHMNKKHWNTVILDSSISYENLTEWIDDSYEAVVSKLTKKQKEILRDM